MIDEKACGARSRPRQPECGSAARRDATPGIVAYKPIEVELLYNGVGLDVLGIGYDHLADSPAPGHVHMMIQRRPRAAGLRTKISAHSFRATGITTYLQNGGKLEIAQQMAGHESAWTTGLYDRRNDQIALDEVERITF